MVREVEKLGSPVIPKRVRWRWPWVIFISHNERLSLILKVAPCASRWRASVPSVWVNILRWVTIQRLDANELSLALLVAPLLKFEACILFNVWWEFIGLIPCHDFSESAYAGLEIVHLIFVVTYQAILILNYLLIVFNCLSILLLHVDSLLIKRLQSFFFASDLSLKLL